MAVSSCSVAAQRQCALCALASRSCHGQGYQGSQYDRTTVEHQEWQYGLLVRETEVGRDEQICADKEGQGNRHEPSPAPTIPRARSDCGNIEHKSWLRDQDHQQSDPPRGYHHGQERKTIPLPPPRREGLGVHTTSTRDAGMEPCRTPTAHLTSR